MNSAKLYVYHRIASVLPPTRCFRLKAAMLRWAGAEVGNGVRIVSSARFHLTGSLRIGDGTWIGEDVLIAGGSESVTIGVNVDVGPRVTLVTGTHELWEIPTRAAGRSYSRPITIEDGVWLGAGVTVLPGVRIGAAAMVAAGAVVVSDVSGRVVVAGVPAKATRLQRVVD